MPIAYTDAQLASFMHGALQDTASDLGWTATVERYQAAIDETLLAYGVADVGQATDIPKLRAIARREVWALVVAATVNAIDYDADGGSFKQEQLHKHAVAMLQRMTDLAAPYTAVVVEQPRAPRQRTVTVCNEVAW